MRKTQKPVEAKQLDSLMLTPHLGIACLDSPPAPGSSVPPRPQHGICKSRIYKHVFWVSIHGRPGTSSTLTREREKETHTRTHAHTGQPLVPVL
ncbi:hypothetical protein LX36DRAFT_664130 [Colletotrichum falcatum]|nr:hypothetical protein LX36DRAFT_664130 [Colletotrichum falcatum]